MEEILKEYCDLILNENAVSVEKLVKLFDLNSLKHPGVNLVLTAASGEVEPGIVTEAEVRKHNKVREHLAKQRPSPK